MYWNVMSSVIKGASTQKVRIATSPPFLSGVSLNVTAAQRLQWGISRDVRPLRNADGASNSSSFARVFSTLRLSTHNHVDYLSCPSKDFHDFLDSRVRRQAPEHDRCLGDLSVQKICQSGEILWRIGRENTTCWRQDATICQWSILI